MYKRDYYIHHDNNNDHPVRKIIPMERNKSKSRDLKAPPHNNTAETREKVGPGTKILYLDFN